MAPDMKQALLVACLMAQAAPDGGLDATPNRNHLPVRLLAGAGVRTMSQLEHSLTGSWTSARQPPFTVRAEGSRSWRKIRNCRELGRIDVKAADTRPEDAWDALNAVSAWCRGVRAIPRARASRQSFLAEILSADNPAAYLPGSVVDIVNAGESAERDPEIEADTKKHALVAWAELDRALRRAAVQTKDRVRFEGKDYLAFASFYAAGDFNGDGVEDVLLQVGIRPFDASRGDATFFIMTRTKSQGLLSVIETFH